jgi:acetyltransferase
MTVSASRQVPARAPSQGACRLRDGTLVLIREIQPDDEPCMVRFHESLSDHSVYLRYFAHLSLAQRTNHRRLAQVCVSDHQRNIVLVVVAEAKFGATAEIVAVGRLCKSPTNHDAEFAIVVADRWQRRGIGTVLLQTLVENARTEGLGRIFGTMLGENRTMRSLCERAGFQMRLEGTGPELRAEMILSPTASPAPPC